MQEYIETKHKKFNRLPIRGESIREKVTVKTKKNTSNLDYKEARQTHKQAIRAQRHAIRESHKTVWSTVFAERKARKEAHRTIRKHKLLKRQAKTLHKLNTI